MCGGGPRRTLGRIVRNVTEEVEMNVLGAELKHEGRGFAAAFGVLAVGVAVSLGLASYAVTTTGSGGKAIAKPSGGASVSWVAPLGPSASLPGANVAELKLYGKALTAHHPPAIDWQAVLGPSASLPGANVAQLKLYGEALTAGRVPVTLGPSASLPGANVAQLKRYGLALTAHR